MSRRVCIILVSVTGVLALLSLLLFRTLELGRGRAVPAMLENLNPDGEFTGPEGLQFDAEGNLFVSDQKSRIWKVEPGARPKLFLDLQQGQLGEPGEIHLGALTFDADGNLYGAAYEYAGGSVIRIASGTAHAEIFARDMGVANFVLATGNGRGIWVSDFRSRGRLLYFPLESSVPAKPDRIIEGFSFPNGLALGRDDRQLFAAETYSGRVVRVDLESASPKIETVADLKGSFAIGSLDGLAFDPRDSERRFLYVAENLRGMITALQVDSSPAIAVKRIRLSMMGGRPCPASIALRDDYLYFSDLWSASPARIVLGFPKWRRSVYRFRVTNLAAIH